MSHNSCGYCGFPLNNLKKLECTSCGHTPWTQYIPYGNSYSKELDDLFKFLDIQDISLENSVSYYLDDE